MIVVHAGEEPPGQWSASILLANPPRSSGMAGWRARALAEIERRWCGPGRLVVFVPEARDEAARPGCAERRAWELYWGDRCDGVLFWAPRGPHAGPTATGVPGRWQDSGRIVLGTPPEAEHATFLRGHARDRNIPFADTLAGTVEHALTLLEPPTARSGGERHVPLLVWHTEAFQSWLAALQDAGNELREARVEWVFRVGPRRQFVLFFALHAAVYVAAEDRVKTNEILVSRPDTASVLAYRRGQTLAETQIVLVREFRTPGTTTDGFVRELPGGSNLAGMADPRAVAIQELREETGLDIDPGRLRAHGSRQAAATISTHRTHLFAVELDEEEMAAARASTSPHGEETERTYVEVVRLGDVLGGTGVDWATLGAIAEVLLDA